MTDVNKLLVSNGKTRRKVRSFVRREGRLTNGQEAALQKCWSSMGIDFQESLLDFSVLFANDAPITLEIGFGMGASLVEMAKNAPDKNFIGIEVHRPGVGACLMAAQSANITNLRVICHDAVEVFAKMLPEQSLACVQLFFPDPWHKKRHHKRRIVQPEFAQMLRSKLQMNGFFHMATDWENYAEYMTKVMNLAEGFKNTATGGDFIPRPKDRPLTKFELRGHRLGHSVWDLKYQKIS